VLEAGKKYVGKQLEQTHPSLQQRMPSKFIFVVPTYTSVLRPTTVLQAEFLFSTSLLNKKWRKTPRE